MHSDLNKLQFTAQETLLATNSMQSTLNSVNSDLIALDEHCEVESNAVKDVKSQVTSLSSTLAGLEAVLGGVVLILQDVKQVLSDHASPTLAWFTIGYSLLAVVLLVALSSWVLTWPSSLSPSSSSSSCRSCLGVSAVCGAVTFTILSLLLFLGFFIALVRL